MGSGRVAMRSGPNDCAAQRFPPARHIASSSSSRVGYFFGKFGSAFTSLICLVCRSLCAAMNRTNS